MLTGLKLLFNTKFGRLDNGIVDFDSKHIVKSIESSFKEAKKQIM